MENLDILVKELCKQPNESGWVEFKHNNWSPQMIGEDISALANSAVLADHSHAYMIWGGGRQYTRNYWNKGETEK